MSIGSAGRDLLVHLLLLPFLELLMTSPHIVGRDGKRAKQRGIAAAASALLVISAVKLGMELSSRQPSFYDMLEVLPSSSTADLKKGYKRASLKVHPDKLHSANAESVADDDGSGDEAFVALKAAYDVLSDSNQRDMYDKFGQPGLDSKDDTTTLLAGLGFFYVMSLMLAYMLTRRRTVSRAQTWAFSGLFALGIFEYQACILSFDFLQESLPQLATFEKIELLHRLYPTYLLGARMVAWFFFEDTDAYNFVTLQHLHWKTDRLRERLELLARAPCNASSAVPQLPPVGDFVTMQHWRELGMDAHGRTSQKLPLAPPGAASVSGAAPVTPRPSNKGGGGGRSMGSLLWFVGVYFFFQWLLGRGS